MTTLETRPAASAVLPDRRGGESALLRHVGEIVCVLLPFVVMVASTRRLADPDLWWHLRTGELILSEGLVGEDPWSFASTHHWLLHEWLSEVVMHGAFTLGGLAGVVVLQALVIGSFAAVVVWSCRRVARPDIAALTAALVIIATAPGFGTRPQLASWVLLAAVCPYLRRSIAARRLPLAMLPLTWVWANLHGLWFTALVLFGALVLGLAVEEGARGWRTTARFCALGGAALGVAALTPNGPALLLGPLRVRDYARFVTEWDPPSILMPTTAAALLLLGIVVVSWARSDARVPPTTIAFVATAVVLGLMYGRTVPVLAIATAPLAAAAVQQASGLKLPVPRLNRWLLAVALAAAAVTLPLMGVRAIGAQAPDPGRALPDGTSSAALQAVAAHLNALPGHAKVLNHYDVGGWLIWTARDTSPAVDGRAELYAIDYLDAYVGALSMRPGWRDFVDDVDVDAALLYRDTPLVEGLRHIGWRTTYEEGGLVVLLPPTGAGAPEVD